MTEQDTLGVLLPFSKYIEKVTSSLSELFKSAIPKILKAQQATQSIKYNNMLTAATFFSAVTATTLQLSYAYNTNPDASLGVAVNTLWFAALVFSTASSLSSLVGLMWYQKIQRIQLLPEWTKLWLEYGPTISLAVASAAFSAGLCLFAFSSSQHIITSTLTVAFTATHAVALFVPLCLYSPNWLSRFLLEFLEDLWAFKTSCFADVECALEAQADEEKPELRTSISEKRPGAAPPKEPAISMRGVTDPGEVAVLAAEKPGKGVDRADARPPLELMHGPIAATSSTGDASPDSSSSLIRVKRNIIMAWMFTRRSLHSAFAWHIPGWPDRLTLRQRRTRATKESGIMEQAHEGGTKVVTLSELEYGIGSQEDAGGLGIQEPFCQSAAPFEGPRTPIPDATNAN
ncbi:hypothetical protein M0805_001294 [Coniferiporia weirii]|nr:hypothetical protein M0805_001294 [Coniferiporia weirii]